MESVNFMVIEKGCEYILFVPAAPLVDEKAVADLRALAEARGAKVYTTAWPNLTTVTLVELDQ
jgi:hypothetical protein